MQIKKKMMEEFEKEARVMDIKVANIIARGKSNFTQFTGPLTDQTAFPASVAAEFAYLAEDEAAFYEELGGTYTKGGRGRYHVSQFTSGRRGTWWRGCSEYTTIVSSFCITTTILSL